MEIYAACGSIFSFFSALSTQKSPCLAGLPPSCPSAASPCDFSRKIPIVCNRSVSHRHFSRHSSCRFAGKREPAFRAGKTMENRHFPQGKTYLTALKSAMVFPQILFNLLICRFFRLCPRSGRKIPRLTRQYDSLTPCAFSLKLHA